MPARHEVLRLQLLAGAGRKARAKVRQPFMPGAGHAHLLRTILGGKFSNRVQIPDGAFGPEKFRGCFERLPFFDAALYPNFVDTLLLPVGKQADRSEEHTSELQSRLHLVCRLLLEKKKNY